MVTVERLSCNPIETMCNDGDDNDGDGLTDCDDDDCTLDEICCDSLVIEAEEMGSHDNGAQVGEYWKLWTNGEMSENVYFPAHDFYHFEIIAKGSLANENGPEMELIIDGVVIETVSVDSEVPTTYEFDVEIQAGDREIAIGFYNDYYNPLLGEDRNLFVDVVIITLMSCIPI